MTLRKAISQGAARRGFTLMEMLIVVAIIVALAGIGTFYILPQFNKSKEGIAQAKAANLEKALTAYYKDYDAWPDQNNLPVLTQKGVNGGPYIEADGLNDPWGKPFRVDVTGSTYHNGAKPDVFTTSPEGKILGNFKAQ